MRFPIFLWAIIFLLQARLVLANPFNGKVVLEAFWWDCLNRNYQTDNDGTGGWYTYLARLCPRLRDLGFDGIWVPPPCKGDNASGMGYDMFDQYDLGQKFQKNKLGTRFGDQDAYLRLIAVAHASGLEVYPDIVLNHMDGGAEDANAPGNKFKTFKYHGFAGSDAGRWQKSWLDFHPNPHHSPGDDDWRKEIFGPDICYHGRCCDIDCDHAGTYMRDNARVWFTWFVKQTDADGFRFDAVKHFPPEIVEDLLFNAMDIGKVDADQRKYFAVGEYVVGKTEGNKIDDWADQTKNRCGTFDFAFREALLDMVNSHGFFDMGSLPNFQQHNRFKTVPFVNNHDTWRGVFSDSSGNGREDHSHNLKNGDEIISTIDPDDGWAKVAYAAAFAIDGSPQVYYEDLFINNDPATREKADPKQIRSRAYLENLVWCHQKLNFKDGAYKVRFQGSQDLLVIERGGKALIGLNDNGNATLPDQPLDVQTDFAPNITLHDYSGSTTQDISTDANGHVKIQVPPKTYCIWAPAGIVGGFSGHPRRTTQVFEMADDLGDSDAQSLGYGGRLSKTVSRKCGTVWAAKDKVMKVALSAKQACAISLEILKPDNHGQKSANDGRIVPEGNSSPNSPLIFTWMPDRDGYYQINARLLDLDAADVLVGVEYEATVDPEKI